MVNLALYNYVKKLHIEILYLWVNIAILSDSNNEIKEDRGTDGFPWFPYVLHVNPLIIGRTSNH